MLFGFWEIGIEFCKLLFCSFECTWVVGILLQLNQDGSGWGTIGAFERQWLGAKEIGTLLHVLERKTFQKDDLRLEECFVHVNKVIVVADSLALYTNKLHATFGKRLGGLDGYVHIAFEQDTKFRAAVALLCLGKDVLYVRCRQSATKLSNVAVANGFVQGDLLHRVAISQKVERGINMSAVVGAHGKVC